MRYIMVFLLLMCNGVFAVEASAVVELVSHQRYENTLRSVIPTGPENNRGFIGDPLQPSADHEATRTLLVEHFETHGFAVEQVPLTIETPRIEGAVNVVATRTGTTRPDEVFILCAHYDSGASNAGYDDNASGVAALMEAAIALSFVETEATIKLIAFDAEELGLRGAHRYAHAAVAAGEDIRGVLNLDMIGYNHLDRNVAWVGRVGVDEAGTSISEDLRNEVIAAVAAHSGGLSAEAGILDGSDHAAFDVPGFRPFPAVQLTEERNPDNSNRPFNPHYHTADDNHETADYLDMSYAVGMTRSAVGWLCDAAVLSGRVNPPITRRLVIQPIQVARSDGSDVVNSAETLFEDIEDQIFAQAGIDVQYEPFRRVDDSRIWQVDNDCVDFELPEERVIGVDGEPLFCLWELASESDSMHHEDTQTLNIWFVRAGSGGGYGTAVIGGNGQMIAAKTIADANNGFGEYPFRRDTIAHELGHNLGLPHPEDDPEATSAESGAQYLMLSGTRTTAKELADVYEPTTNPDGVDRLSLRQIAIILDSPFIKDIEETEPTYRSITIEVQESGTTVSIEVDIEPIDSEQPVDGPPLSLDELDPAAAYRLIITRLQALSADG